MFYIPFFMSGYYSLTKWDGIAKKPEFIGFDNFIQIFTADKTFLNAMLFTGKYMIFFCGYRQCTGTSSGGDAGKEIKDGQPLKGGVLRPIYHEHDHCGIYLEIHLSAGV